MHQNKRTISFQNEVSFDKNEIRKKIIIPTFNQARRQENIYKALIQEFYEEGCPTSAKYFQELMNKEDSLYENASIRERFLDEPKLLLGLFDNCKVAEKAALLGQSDGPTVCSRLLLQCILILQSYKKKYDWVMEDVFKTIIKTCENVCQEKDISKESLCQIYYIYGIFLKRSDIEKSVNYLQKCFDLARGTTWMTLENEFNGKSQLLSSVIAKEYADALLKFANNVFQKNPQQAIDEAQKAVLIIIGEGIEHNMNMYIKAYLDMTDFQIKAKNYETSLKILEKISIIIKPHIREDVEYEKFLSRYYHLKGKCYEGLKKNEPSLFALHKALKISRHLQMKHEEGNILMDIAKVYIECGRSQYRIAESCLNQSKVIFENLKDMFNVRKTSYLLASLKVHNIQPMILDLIKYSPINYCDKYRLIHWKGMCLPFWRNLRQNMEQEEKNPIQCIMRTAAENERESRKSSFQHIEKSVNYLQKCFDLARGTTWMTLENEFNGKSQLLSSVIAKEYADALLKFANNVFQKNPQQAIDEAQKAVLIIIGEGIEHNMNMYIKAYLDMTDFQIKAKNYETSLKILEKISIIIKPHIREDVEYEKFLSRYYHLKGKCYEGLKKNEPSLFALHKALKISRHLQMKHEEGNILMDIAKVYIECGRSQYRIAESCLNQSKVIFENLKDMFNVRKTSYLLASLKVHNIQPMILDLIKYSPINYCDKYRLIHWKGMCLPFWRNLRQNMEQEEKNPIQCIMRTAAENERESRKSSFQRKSPKG